MPVTAQIPVTGDYREALLAAGYADFVKGLLVIGDHLYLCGGDSQGSGPGHLLKIRKDDFSVRSVITFSDDNQHHQAVDAVYSTAADRIYVVFSNNHLISQLLIVAEVNPNSGSNTAPVVTNEFFVNEADISMGNGSMTIENASTSALSNLYIVTWGIDPARVVKVRLSDGFATLGPALTGNHPYGWVIKYDGGKLYAYGKTEAEFGDTWVKRINPDSASLQVEAGGSTVIANGTDFTLMTEDMGISSQYLWIGRRGNPTVAGIIKKVNKSNFAVTDYATGINGPCRIVRNAGSYIWGLYDNGKAVRINPTDETKALYTLNDGQGFQSQIGTDADNFLYTAWNQQATKIARYRIPSDAVSGQNEWLTTFGSPEGSSTSFADYANVIAAAVDSSGNSIVVGEMQYKVNFGNVTRISNGDKDAFVAKYDSSGAPVWAFNFGGAAGSDVANGVACDSAGNIYVIGQFTGTVQFGSIPLTSLGFSDIFLLKLDSSGTVLLAKRFGGSSTDIGTAICVDQSDNVIAAGYFGSNNVTFGGGTFNTNGQQDIFIAKFDSGLNHLQSRTYGGSALDQPHGIAVGASGHPILVGKFRGTTNLGSGAITSLGDSDGFAAMYDKDTLLIRPGWPRIIGNSYGATVYGAAVDPISGDVVIVGDFVAPVNAQPQDPINFGGGNTTTPQAGSIFIVKYSAANVFQWQLIFGTTDFSAPHVNGVDIDDSGNVIFIGDVTAAEDFGKGLLNGIGGTDSFLVKYSSDKQTCHWTRRAQLAGDFGKAVVVAPDRHIIAAGWYQNRLRWETTQEYRLSPGGDSGYVAKFTP